MALQIIRNDITKVTADAVVNSANPLPRYAAGSDAAVYKAAGRLRLLAARKKIGTIAVGDAAVTPAFSLPAKYIIHTVGPIWRGGDSGEQEDLRRCYVSCLRMAERYECDSVAFPLISTGIYGFPKPKALEIALTVFRDYLQYADMEIILVVFDRESFALTGNLFSDVKSFIDENYVDESMFITYNSSAVNDSMSADEMAGEEWTGREDRTNLLEAEPIARPYIPKKRRLEDVVAEVGESFQQSLFRRIDEKGYTDTEVYKRANLSRKLFSKIRSNPSYQPKKNTAVALALALRLSLDETKDFLARAGYAFSPGSVFDLIVSYFIEQGVYDIYTINLTLFEYEQPILGD